ncbi:spore coat protein U domain-containing protein [Rhizobacter sp. P5_C2]
MSFAQRSGALAGTLALLAVPATAAGAVSCTLMLSSPSGSVAAPGALTLGGTLTVQCTKAADSPLASASFSATVGSTHALAAEDNAGRGIGYGLWQDATASTPWGSSAPYALSGSVVFAGGPMASTQLPFYLVAPARAFRPAAGSYRDTLLVTLAYNVDGSAARSGGSTGSGSGTGGVALDVPPACSLSMPTAVTLDYVAFQSAPAIAANSFSADCNTGYALALDSGGGTLLGLPYTLTLDADSGLYDGQVHQHHVTGRIDAGLAGSCAAAPCQASRIHWLTISY